MSAPSAVVPAPAAAVRSEDVIARKVSARGPTRAKSLVERVVMSRSRGAQTDLEWDELTAVRQLREYALKRWAIARMGRSRGGRRCGEGLGLAGWSRDGYPRTTWTSSSKLGLCTMSISVVGVWKERSARCGMRDAAA